MANNQITVLLIYMIVLTIRTHNYAQKHFRLHLKKKKKKYF